MNEGMPYELLTSDVSDTAKLTYAYLAHIGDENGCAWPSSETIGNAIRKSGRQIRRALVELREAGWIATQRRYNSSTVYRLERMVTDDQSERMDTDDHSLERMDTHDHSVERMDTDDHSLQERMDTGVRLAVYIDNSPYKGDIESNRYIGGAEKNFEVEPIPLNSRQDMSERKGFGNLFSYIETSSKSFSDAFYASQLRSYLGAFGIAAEEAELAHFLTSPSWRELGALMERSSPALPPRKSPKALGGAVGTEGAAEALANLQRELSMVGVQ